MTTIIMLFILPLGIIIFIWDKKIEKENALLFENYTPKLRDSDLRDKEKLLQIDAMYYNNGYTRAEMNENSLTVEKKHFNLGTLFISFGLTAYIGLFLYIGHL